MGYQVGRIVSNELVHLLDMSREKAMLNITSNCDLIHSYLSDSVGVPTVNDKAVDKKHALWEYFKNVMSSYVLAALERPELSLKSSAPNLREDCLQILWVQQTYLEQEKVLL